MAVLISDSGFFLDCDRDKRPSNDLFTSSIIYYVQPLSVWGVKGAGSSTMGNTTYIDKTFIPSCIKFERKKRLFIFNRCNLWSEAV